MYAQKPIAQKMTADEFLSWHEMQDERYELLEGTVALSPHLLPIHQRVSGYISFRLYSFLEIQPWGEVFSAMECVLNDLNVVQPDLAFYTADKIARLDTTKGYNRFRGEGPDFAIEILSPSNAENDLLRKRRLYEAAGVAEYWIVDFEKREVRVLINTADGFKETIAKNGVLPSKAVDGFSVNLDEFWKRVFR